MDVTEYHGPTSVYTPIPRGDGIDPGANPRPRGLQTWRGNFHSAKELETLAVAYLHTRPIRVLLTSPRASR